MNRAAPQLTLEVGIAQHVMHLLKTDVLQQQHRSEAEHLPATHRECGLGGEQGCTDLLQRYQDLSIPAGVLNDLAHEIASMGLHDGTQTTLRLGNESIEQLSFQKVCLKAARSVDALPYRQRHELLEPFMRSFTQYGGVTAIKLILEASKGIQSNYPLNTPTMQKRRADLTTSW